MKWQTKNCINSKKGMRDTKLGLEMEKRASWKLFKVRGGGKLILHLSNELHELLLPSLAACLHMTQNIE